MRRAGALALLVVIVAALASLASPGPARIAVEDANGTGPSIALSTRVTSSSAAFGYDSAANFARASARLVGYGSAPNTTRAVAEIGPAGNPGAFPGVRTQLHHSDPMFLGGAPKQPLTTLSRADHSALHGDLNSFLRGRTDAFGNHMAPTTANPGAMIRANFTRGDRLQALADFYRGPGSVYGQPAIDFFTQHPGL